MTDAEYDAYRASRSMLRYSALPVLRTLPGERVPEWACVCPGLKAWKRHRQPWECLSQKEVDRWARTNGVKNLRAARELMWMALTFDRTTASTPGTATPA